MIGFAVSRKINLKASGVPDLWSRTCRQVRKKKKKNIREKQKKKLIRATKRTEVNKEKLEVTSELEEKQRKTGGCTGSGGFFHRAESSRGSRFPQRRNYY